MRKSAKDLLETSEEDMTNLKSQLLDLTTRWDNVNQLNSNKDARLQVTTDYSRIKSGRTAMRHLCAIFIKLVYAICVLNLT